MVRILKYYTALLILLCSLQLNAQEELSTEYNEFYMSFGTNFLPFEIDEEKRFNTDQVWPINSNAPGLVEVSSGIIKFISSKGAFTFGFNRHIDKHIIGILAIYEPQHMSFMRNVFLLDLNTGTTERIGFNTYSESDIKNYGLALRYDYNWLHKNKLRIFSGVSSGIYSRSSKTTYYQVNLFQEEFPETLEDFLRYKDTEYHLHLHFNLLGIRFGNKWAINLESGIGNRGYVNVGISRIFDN